MNFTLTCACLVLSTVAATAWVQAPASKPKRELSAAAQLLQAEVGVWDALIQAGGKEYRGTLTVERGPAGNGIISQLQADFGGRPFEGRGIEAWDPARGKYVAFWVYNLSEQPLQFEGTWDEGQQTRRLQAEVPDAKGAAPKRETHVTRCVGADQREFRILLESGGKSTEMLSINYRRRS